MAASKERSGTFFWFVFSVISIVMALVLTFVTADYARVESIEEAKKIEATFGEQTLLTVNRLSAEWYRQSVDKLRIPKDLTKEMAEQHSVAVFGFKSEKLWRALERRADAILDLSYWFLRRIALFVVWLPFWVPMFIMAAMHGYWDREIKKTDFGYTSPVINHASRQVMRFVTMVTLLLFVLPIALEPWIFPFFLALETVMAGLAIGNVQKRI